MDPITTAIVAALAAGAVSGVVEPIVSDIYGKLKELLAKKYGARSDLVKAVKELEANPTSAARKEVVKEEVMNAKADQDKELLQVAHLLLKSVKALPKGAQIIQATIGDQNVQIAGDGNSVNVNTHKGKR